MVIYTCLMRLLSKVFKITVCSYAFISLFWIYIWFVTKHGEYPPHPFYGEGTSLLNRYLVTSGVFSAIYCFVFIVSQMVKDPEPVKKSVKPGFITSLLGMGVLMFIPAILLIADQSLIRFGKPYLSLMSFLGFVTAIILSKFKPPIKHRILKFIPLLTLTVPFSILATYPFDYISISLVLCVLFFGLTLPQWNIYLTWWFYTIGGLFPLPKDHNWMIGQKNYKSSGRAYTEFVLKTAGVTSTGSLIGVFIINNFGVSGALLFLKALSISLLFAFALTFGADTKKRSLV
jgi:hypothetical protein